MVRKWLPWGPILRFKKNRRTLTIDSELAPFNWWIPRFSGCRLGERSKTIDAIADDPAQMMANGAKIELLGHKLSDSDSLTIRRLL
jgi:hypothetical protein